jgi:hypothetical protein
VSITNSSAEPSSSDAWQPVSSWSGPSSTTICTPEVVERRLAVAKDELAAEAEFDHVVVNSDVKQVCEELVTLLGYRP